ncbi:hypothetical protein G6F46_003916 [Rhizopus delemar]|uniref:Secreted protein n=3 Tax=Rhizopus TaxID=4842 RepID=I1CKH7_RHIO9|nr:hypothetical protein RO3G_13668 [Rhizopus delemar RA 99-880]KAG1461772.1 hypothetical protein G6F55_003373 [Rhizopus delemar]KAG1547750.1 hypothetical protein G6F51_004078 [Rhizopus arrhizus]KAG1501058.1 hypothetical protein G6F54_003304 [Rhizopus delemar]KAG1509752.1 hypothetical protein G6F52_011068 [Rhizopus delemar]|eukprot:EIE88957.1 hypothetical protein RO3G_13668 [Rhizopus delemar RA 99-880]
MRSVLVIFGLLSAFMLVSSLPLGPATLEKRQVPDPNALVGGLPFVGSLVGGGGAHAPTHAHAPAPDASDDDDDDDDDADDAD